MVATMKIVTKINVGLITLLFSAIGYSQEAPKTLSKCFEQKTNLVVVRVDENNKRLFVISKKLPENQFKEILPLSEICFKDTPWKTEWSISIFTDKKFAGYKNESDIIPYHKGNIWAQSYIGEYEGKNKRYMSYPALQK